MQGIREWISFRYDRHLWYKFGSLDQGHHHRHHHLQTRTSKRHRGRLTDAKAVREFPNIINLLTKLGEACACALCETEWNYRASRSDIFTALSGQPNLFVRHLHNWSIWPRVDQGAREWNRAKLYKAWRLRSQQSNTIGKAFWTTDSFSSLPAGSLRSGINGGLPAVVKKVGCPLSQTRRHQLVLWNNWLWLGAKDRRRTGHQGQLHLQLRLSSDYSDHLKKDIYSLATDQRKMSCLPATEITSKVEFNASGRWSAKKDCKSWKFANCSWRQNKLGACHNLYTRAHQITCNANRIAFSRRSEPNRIIELL